MQSDKYSNPIFQEHDIIDLIYKGHIDQLDQIIVNGTSGIKQLAEHAGLNLKFNQELDIDLSDFDKICQSDWFMPEDYYPNLVEMLYGMCTTQEQTDRVSEELTAFIEHGMMDLLFYLKYLVDTLRANNVVWGVGRGSSVASYVLYLIGVHRIDSLKYNLDWREFLR